MAEHRISVATHGHCFDGLCSAVVFSRLVTALRGDAPTFTYRACEYGAGDSAVPASALDGDDNAILDFRYTAVPTLTWYFDHHATAFRSDDDRARYDAGLPANRFYEPAYTSCTKLIADVARTRFGLAFPELDDLVTWADRVDAAAFPDAETAVVRRDPALWLSTVTEHCSDDAFLARMVPRLLAQPLDEVARSADVLERYAPLAEKRAAALSLLRAHAEARGSVAYCDLADATPDVTEKFGLYALFPSCRYSVVVLRGPGRVKVGVGFNPWCGRPNVHHIGSICARHGGGGHPVVGALALPLAEIDRARAIAASIAEELDG